MVNGNIMDLADAVFRLFKLGHLDMCLLVVSGKLRA